MHEHFLRLHPSERVSSDVSIACSALLCSHEDTRTYAFGSEILQRWSLVRRSLNSYLSATIGSTIRSVSADGLVGLGTSVAITVGPLDLSVVTQ